MSANDKPTPLVSAARIAAGGEYPFSHPLNPSSLIHFRDFDGKTMGELAGLRRVSVYTARIPAGKESFVYHRHHHEEEFFFVLSGRGLVEIGDEVHEIGPGDFVGFAAGPQTPGHHLRNPFEADLVLLMGGERRDAEVADFPRLGKKLIRSSGGTFLVDDAALKPLGGEGG